jgi:hypothetical protein
MSIIDARASTSSSVCSSSVIPWADENDLGPFYANEYATITAIAPPVSHG